MKAGNTDAFRRGRLDCAQLGVSRGGGRAPIRHSLDRSPDEATAPGLARRHELSIYDAVGLELAVRLSAPLATRDVALTKAARAERIVLIEAKIGWPVFPIPLVFYLRGSAILKAFIPRERLKPLYRAKD